VEGQFRFDVTAPPGQVVVVDTSPDLVSWLPIWTNSFAGPTNFSDAQSSLSDRFYRARLPQPNVVSLSGATTFCCICNKRLSYF
jgi:hypothetical protein